MTSQKIFFSSLVGLGLLLLYSGFRLPAAYAESPEKFKSEQEVIRVQMVQLSRELGVTCTDCHSSKNWKDDSKTNFKIARDHIKTVEVLRSNGFNGKKYPEASCYMCHQGKLKFVSKMQHPETVPSAAPSNQEH